MLSCQEGAHMPQEHVSSERFSTTALESGGERGRGGTLGPRGRLDLTGPVNWNQILWFSASPFVFASLSPITFCTVCAYVVTSPSIIK